MGLGSRKVVSTPHKRYDYLRSPIQVIPREYETLNLMEDSEEASCSYFQMDITKYKLW